MRKSLALLVTALLMIQAPVMATPKVASGASCSKAGAIKVVSGKRFTCIKSGKKIVWNKGVLLKENQKISADPIADVAISTAFFPINVYSSSGLMIQANSSTPQICQVNLLMIVVVEKTGSCVLTFTQPGNSNFNAAVPVTLSFSVTKMNQEITTNDDSKMEIVEKTQTVYWNATSGLDVIHTTLTPRICTIQNNILTLLTIGTCEIRGAQSGNDEYLPAQSLLFKYEIVKAAQQIKFDRIADIKIDEMYIDLDAYSDSPDENMKPEYTTSTQKVCNVDGVRVEFLAVGDCTVLATHPGNDLYAPAPIVSQTFKVLPARIGSLQNPAIPGMTIISDTSEVTFIEFTEKVDMFTICKQSGLYDGCTYDKNYNGVPDPSSENKLVALLFEYKNSGKSAGDVQLIFSIVSEDEFIDTLFRYVPRDLLSKKLLPNSKARGYVYVSIPKSSNMNNALLFFEYFDKDSEDIYVAVRKP